MAEARFLFLPGGPLARVSYFPATELAKAPGTSWLEEHLAGAVRLIAKRRAKAIRDTPITFWVGVRGTARNPEGEVFVFTTPYKVRRQVDEAVRAALSTLPDAKVAEGVEPVAEPLVPCFQAYRNKLIRFYTRREGKYYEPCIEWDAEHGAPLMRL